VPLVYVCLYVFMCKQVRKYVYEYLCINSLLLLNDVSVEISTSVDVCYIFMCMYVCVNMKVYIRVHISTCL